MQGTMPGARRRGRPRTAWMDNIKTWTGLSVKESIRMTEDRDKWRKCVHGVANPRIARTAKEQNRIEQHQLTPSFTKQKQLSAVSLTRATKSCCRQSLTICVMNYSGRASELGGTVNVVDRRPSLSRSKRRYVSRAKLITRFDMPWWQNFLSPELGEKFPREVPLFL